MMRYRQIEVFYAVMTHGTVTAAAQFLNITQPTATATLKNAEAELGFQLFHRHGGRLVPTREASILLGEVRRAHNSLQAINIMAGNLKEGISDHLRIAATPVISLNVLPSAVAKFSRGAELYSYEVTSQHSNEILNDLENRTGRYSLGLTFGIGNFSNLGHQRVGSAALYCLAPKAWAVPDEEKFDISFFSSVPMIATFEADPLGLAVQQLLSERDIQPDIVAKVHAHQVAAALVSEQVGAAILDALTVKHAMEGPSANNLVYYRLDDAEPLPIMAVYSHLRQLAPAALRFVECFEEALNNQAELELLDT